PYYPSLLDDLIWTRQVLVRRVAGVEELAAARAVWSWHDRFEKDPKLKEAAAELERIYAANELAKEFEPLLSHEDLKQTDQRVSAKGADLARLARSEEITSFVNRAVSFLGEEQKLYSLAGVAWAMGGYAESQEVVRQFVASCIGRLNVTPSSDFGVAAAI